MPKSRPRRQDDDNDDNDDDVIVVEVLSDLLRSTGLVSSFFRRDDNKVDNSENDVWIHLSSALNSVANGLRRLQQQHHDEKGESDSIRFDDVKDDTVLLEVEESTHRVRVQMQLMSLQLMNDTSNHLKQCHRLEKCRDSELILLAKSLASSFRKQKVLTLQSLKAVEKELSKMYDTTVNLMSIASKLDSLAERFQIRFVGPVDVPPWSDAMEWLEKIADDVSLLDDTIVGQPSQVVAFAKLDVKPTVTPTLEYPISAFSGPIFDIVTKSLASKHFGARLIQLVGQEGSGKSYYLTEIEEKAGADGATVLRPLLPFFAMGATVGAAEDLLISMVSSAFCATGSKPSVLILDDLDTICGRGEVSRTTGDTDREPHLTARLRALLMDLLDNVKKGTGCDGGGNGTTIICSSKMSFGESVGRFDQTFTLSPPNREERSSLLVACLLEGRQLNHDQETLRDELAECTEGMSRGELAQLCRKSLARYSSETEQAENLLRYVKNELQRSTPESLKSGINTDFLDLTVFTATDLQKRHPITSLDPIDNLPLYGASAQAAWETLRRLVVLPLCQGQALDRILYQRGDFPKKAFTGGVLLTGRSGTGKSTLSYFCAAFASTLNPSVKLIDVSCTSLIHKEVGVSEKAIHRLFQTIRSAAPCVVVMDGMENIASPRGNDNTTEGTMDRVLSTLLTELDGIDNQDFLAGKSTASVMIIGITQNPCWIDPALRRPGRLEKSISLGILEFNARQQIILNQLKNTSFKPQDEHPDLYSVKTLANQVAAESEGFTGAGLVAVCNLAKMQASKDFFHQQGTDVDAGGGPLITPDLVLGAMKSHFSEQPA